MNTDIRNKMNDSDEAIDYFNAAVDEIAGAKSLLAERRITDLLKTISYFSKLYELFKHALNGFNYRAEFHKAVVSVKGRVTLKLPANHLKCAAFVFCLLLEIDSEKQPLKDVLETYFYHTDPAWQFRAFLDAVLSPFKSAVNHLFTNGYDSFVEDDAVDESLKTAARRLIDELRQRASVPGGDATPAKKEELLLLLNALSESLTPGRVELLRPLLIGLKNTAYGSLFYKDTLAPGVSKLYKLLSSGGLL